MQSSANMQLTPEEDTTVSVSANELCDLVEGGLCVMGLSWLAVGNGNECIPFPSAQEVYPGIL